MKEGKSFPYYVSAGTLRRGVSQSRTRNERDVMDADIKTRWSKMLVPLSERCLSSLRTTELYAELAR
ncbi:hypothetical protein CEXT_30001 [Caerostris extrusa]|uniref:Uncharacterized protein n=1 Tax=Caerostris extrusa TaxID=172846 RepID=A0AAV4YC63_CAEEX|nr:hypothetical protein CEXT_30001 [Caerostris extrusa]